VTTAGAPSKITVAIAAFDAHNWYRFGVQKKASGLENTQLNQPGAAEFFDQQTQGSRTTIGLALINQSGEERQVIRTDESRKLGLAGKRNEIHG